MLVSGYSISKGSYPYFSQHPVSSIQYIANCGINDRFHDVVIFWLRLVRIMITLFIWIPWFSADLNPEPMNP